MSEFDLFETALQEYNSKSCTPSVICDDSEDDCEHINTNEESSVLLCLDCGKELKKTIYQDKEWRYYGQSDNKRTSDPNRVQIRKVEDRSIYKDVEGMGFSDKIISLANQIYLQVTKGKIYRGNSRKAIVFACIFNAFKLEGRPQTQDNLRKLFNLSKKTSSTGLKQVNLNVPKDSPVHTIFITPENLIEDTMCKFKATVEQKAEVIELYKRIKNKSSAINRARPQSIAAGITYYWISIKDIEITLKEFAQKVSLSESTISKISHEMAEIIGKVPDSWM